MRIFTTDRFSLTERDLFLDAYKSLLGLVPSRIPVSEWKLIKKYILRGIEAGIYDRDSHGIHSLVHLCLTCQVLHRQVGLGRRSILTVLLYPLAEHDVISREEVTKDFGEEVAHLMSCMGKVKHLYKEHDNLEDENFRKLMLSFAQDIRVIICLICDRYILMKALNHTEDFAYREKVTAECRLIYTPLAHRLGLYVIKGEMEDMAVKYEHREIFDDIAQQLQDTKTAREEYIREFIAPLEARLKEVLPEPFHIKGRTKSIASIWNKIKKQNKRVDQIYDLFAIRIIIDTDKLSMEKALCWQAYSVVADMYQPNPKRLKDWLSIPKSNGYESLHITVYGPKERWVEVQIRTKRMDDIAERGLAAHWKYKGIKSQGAADDVMASIREILESGTATGDLMKDFSMGLYEEEVFCFTPNGDVHKFPKGATVLDFAFHIHSRIGDRCIGAKINGKSVPIREKLNSGDQVEILTSTNQKPKQDWLNWVTTSKARTKIRQSIKEETVKQTVFARETLERKFKNRKIDFEEAIMARLIKKMGYKVATDFYADITNDLLDVNLVIDKYIELQKYDRGELETAAARTAQDFHLEEEDVKTHASTDVLVIDENLKGVDFTLAKCCSPIYGDEIFGFVTVNGGFKIHRCDCPNANDLRSRFGYRIIRAKWAGKGGSQYQSTLHIVGRDDIGIVNNITSIILKEPTTTLRSISINSNDGMFSGTLTVSVGDNRNLEALIKKLKTVKGVLNITR